MLSSAQRRGMTTKLSSIPLGTLRSRLWLSLLHRMSTARSVGCLHGRACRRASIRGASVLEDNVFRLEFSEVFRSRRFVGLETGLSVPGGKELFVVRRDAALVRRCWVPLGKNCLLSKTKASDEAVVPKKIPWHRSLQCLFPSFALSLFLSFHFLSLARSFVRSVSPSIPSISQSVGRSLGRPIHESMNQIN